MKSNVKKCMLEAVRKTVKAGAGNGDSLFCPVIFHQPKRPEKKQSIQKNGR